MGGVRIRPEMKSTSASRGRPGYQPYTDSSKFSNQISHSPVYHFKSNISTTSLASSIGVFNISVYISKYEHFLLSVFNLKI